MPPKNENYATTSETSTHLQHLGYIWATFGQLFGPLGCLNPLLLGDFKNEKNLTKIRPRRISAPGHDFDAHIAPKGSQVYPNGAQSVPSGGLCALCGAFLAPWGQHGVHSGAIWMFF